MALSDNGKKILVWSTIVAILGVGGYFGYKWYKKRKDGKGTGSQDTPPVTDSSVTNNSGSGSGSSSGGGSGSTASPFKTEAEIKAFQDWLDKKHPFWVKDTDGKYKNLRVGTTAEPNRHVGGKGYGRYGSNTANAYSIWGGEYVVTLTTISSETGVKPKQEDIDKIRGNASITMSQKDGLINRNADFIKSWADSFRNNRTAFIWANQVYRTLTGERVLDYNPYLKNMKSNKAGNIAYEYPTKSASSGYVAKNKEVGLVRDYKYNQGNLWFYLPDNGGSKKWGIAEDFTKI
jgi:hypothetical protein